MILDFRFRNILLFALLLFVLTSCEKNNCLSSGGDIIIEERGLDKFKYIVINNNFEIYLKNDTVHKVEIEAGNKLIPYIETKVEGDTLTITDLNKCDFVKGYDSKKLIISVDTLKQITLYASDLYTVDTFKVHSLYVLFLSQLAYCDLTVDAHSFKLSIWYASGDFKVSGKTDVAYLGTEQTSFIYAENLENTTCNVNNNSMGDCYVKAGKNLYYSIRNSGNIYYSETPDTVIINEHSGTGKLFKLN